jgi:hypothetical protein
MRLALLSGKLRIHLAPFISSDIGTERSVRELFTLQGWREDVVFSWLRCGGNRNPEPVEGNVEEVSPPAIASCSGEAGGTPPQISC